MPGSTTAPLTYFRHGYDVVKYTLTDNKENLEETVPLPGVEPTTPRSTARGAKPLSHRAHVLKLTNGKLSIYTIYRLRYSELGGFSEFLSSLARWREERAGRALKVVAPLVTMRARFYRECFSCS